MRAKLVGAALSAIVLVPAMAGAAAPSRLLLALSKADHTLAIVDPASLKVIARLPVGPDPHEVIAASDGTLAFVFNTGCGRCRELDILDLVALGLRCT